MSAQNPPPEGPLTGPQQGSGYPGPPAGYPGQQPPPGYAGPPQAYGGQPPDMMGPRDQQSYGDEPPASSRRGVKVLIITAVLALIAGGGAFAFYQADPLHMFGEEPQAAEALSADALFYLGVDMDPTASQKIKALQFLNHFPAFREEADVDEDTDVRDRLFSEALAETGCEGVSYEDTMKPWLGEKFGMAVMKPADGESDPDVVVALEVTDEAKADEQLSKLEGCSESDDAEFGFAFVGDYALLAETTELADGFASDAADNSLADSGEFQADMESLGDLGVATLWVDVKGSLDVATSEILGRGDDMENQLDFLEAQYQRVAATFRFESDAVEIVTTVYGDSVDISHDENQIVTLPDSSVMALSQAGGAARLDASWADIKELGEAEGVDFEQELADFEAESGFSLPDDLETILGDNIMFVADAEGLTSEALESEQFDAVNAGIRFTGDAEAQKALYDEVLQLLGAEGGMPLTTLEAEDGFVLATNDSYAETLKDLGGDLGGSEAFTSVIEDAESKEVVFYFNWDLVEDQVIDAVSDDPEAAENIKPLRAVGITVDIDGDYTSIVTKISVND